eukprot:m.1637175 g.1637175  ORF g.1637175 m.1637175 type:complete len:354 (+) comp25552_c0_seq1:794-1855(+)
MVLLWKRYNNDSTKRPRVINPDTIMTNAVFEQFGQPHVPSFVTSAELGLVNAHENSSATDKDTSTGQTATGVYKTAPAVKYVNDNTTSAFALFEKASNRSHHPVQGMEPSGNVEYATPEYATMQQHGVQLTEQEGEVYASLESSTDRPERRDTQEQYAALHQLGDDSTARAAGSIPRPLHTAAPTSQPTATQRAGSAVKAACPTQPVYAALNAPLISATARDGERAVYQNIDDNADGDAASSMAPTYARLHSESTAAPMYAVPIGLDRIEPETSTDPAPGPYVNVVLQRGTTDAHAQTECGANGTPAPAHRYVNVATQPTGPSHTPARPQYSHLLPQDRDDRLEVVQYAVPDR